MFTLILAAIHAFRTNQEFEPTMLYVGTVFIDVMLIEGIVAIFRNTGAL